MPKKAPLFDCQFCCNTFIKTALWKSDVIVYINYLKFFEIDKANQLCHTCLGQMIIDLKLEFDSRSARQKKIDKRGQEIISQQKYFDETVAKAHKENRQIIVELDKNMDVFDDMMKLFLKNKPYRCNSIVRIERNINPDLERKFLAKSINLDTQYLFHGSRNENYDLILKYGFDIEKSKNGLMGYGIYVAVTASMSSGYTHDIDTEIGKLQNMLICRTAYDPKRDDENTASTTKFYCIKDEERLYPEFIIYYTLK
jgi:hypothetical protein